MSNVKKIKWIISQSFCKVGKCISSSTLSNHAICIRTFYKYVTLWIGMNDWKESEIICKQSFKLHNFTCDTHSRGNYMTFSWLAFFIDNIIVFFTKFLLPCMRWNFHIRDTFYYYACKIIWMKIIDLDTEWIMSDINLLRNDYEFDGFGIFSWICNK